MRSHDSVEQLKKALDILSAAADDNVQRARLVKRRLAWIRRRLDAHAPLHEIVRDEDRPLVTELVTENIDALLHAGSLVRWAEAEQLRAEGMSIAEIARQLGVSRQRISALLQNPPKSVESEPLSGK